MKLLHIGLDAAKTPDTSLMKTFKRHVTEYKDLNTGNPDLNNQIVKLAYDYQPDFTFMQIQAPGIVSMDAIHALTKSFTCNWSGDVRSELPAWYIETGKYIDLTLFSNMVDVEKARAKGINADYLQIGIDPDIYYPMDLTKDIDIAFFANHYGDGYFPLSKYRHEIAVFLARYYGRRFKLYGNGWRSAHGNFNHSQPEEAKELNRCKIAINISHFNYKRYSSDRLFRILGCGVLCVTHEFPEMELLGLVDGKTCATFKTETELADKINFYLQNETERKKVAAAGYEVSKEFTFDKMIERLLKFKA